MWWSEVARSQASFQTVITNRLLIICSGSLRQTEIIKVDNTEALQLLLIDQKRRNTCLRRNNRSSNPEMKKPFLYELFFLLHSDLNRLFNEADNSSDLWMQLKYCDITSCKPSAPPPWQSDNAATPPRLILSPTGGMHRLRLFRATRRRIKAWGRRGSLSHTIIDPPGWDGMITDIKTPIWTQGFFPFCPESDSSVHHVTLFVSYDIH